MENQKSEFEATKQLNEFQAQTRASMLAGLKLILLVSGGMLTFSIGAILNKSPIIPKDLLPLLTWGWHFLFLSMFSGLVAIAGMALASYLMGESWMSKLLSNDRRLSRVYAPCWIRCLNICFGLIALASCLIGLVLMSLVATGIASNSIT